MTTVAVLTTHVARHELYRVHGQYRLITTAPGVAPNDLLRQDFGRPMERDKAMEWIDTTARCGGVVHQREVV